MADEQRWEVEWKDGAPVDLLEFRGDCGIRLGGGDFRLSVSEALAIAKVARADGERQVTERVRAEILAEYGKPSDHTLSDDSLRAMLSEERAKTLREVARTLRAYDKDEEAMMLGCAARAGWVWDRACRYWAKRLEEMAGARGIRDEYCDRERIAAALEQEADGLIAAAEKVARKSRPDFPGRRPDEMARRRGEHYREWAECKYQIAHRLRVGTLPPASPATPGSV